MQTLTETQVKELNQKINELYKQNKAIRVFIDDEEHYIAEVQEDIAIYYDGSYWEGGLDDMTFMDYSPDDGCEFDDFDQLQFEEFVKELFDQKSVVEIVLVIEAADNDYGEIDYCLDKTCGLKGYITEKALVDDEDTYIALARLSALTEEYEILSYHPTILKGIDERATDVFMLGIALAKVEHAIKIIGSKLILVTLKNVDQKEYYSWAEHLKKLNFPVQEFSDTELLLEYQQ